MGVEVAANNHVKTRAADVLAGQVAGDRQQAHVLGLANLACGRIALDEGDRRDHQLVHHQITLVKHHTLVLKGVGGVEKSVVPDQPRLVCCPGIEIGE